MMIRTDIRKLTIKGDEEELRAFALAALDAIERGLAKGSIGEDDDHIRVKFVNTEYDRQ